MKKLYVGAALAAALLLTSTACSAGTPASPGADSSRQAAESGTPLVDALMKKASQNMKEAKSVKMVLEQTKDGKPFKMTYAGMVDATNGTLKLSLDGGEPMTVLLVDGKAYSLIDAAMEKMAGAPLPKEMFGKYKMSEDKDFKQMAPKTIFSEITKEWDKANILSNVRGEVKKGQFEGAEAWLVEDRVEKNGDKLYFTTDGKQDFSGLETVKPEKMKMQFAEWNAVAPVAAPAANLLIEG